MITACEICGRKQVLCSSCEESHRAVCLTTEDIISRCYEHGQPDYVLAADRLKLLQKKLSEPVQPIQKAYALLWRDLSQPPAEFAKQARKILREALSYEETRDAISWVKQIHPIIDDEIII